jgi:hypothetical protein
MSTALSLYSLTPNKQNKEECGRGRNMYGRRQERK